MKCYYCNSRLADERNVCPKCGRDVRLYKKIIYTSNQYYNIGLERAKARDLSGAAESLRISIQLYKKNINARNLLGLVYYEMGEAALALKEWVISKNFHHRGNAADRYIEMLRENRRALDSADHSIHKYNQALEYAKSGSKEMALIQLKKVISVNPRMIKAYQLLALMYMDDQKYDLAKDVINRCLAIDRGNPITLAYQRELSKYKTPVKEKIGVAGELEREEVIIPVRMRDYGTYLSSAMYIFLGFLLSLGVLYYVIMPGKEASYQAKKDQEILSYEEKYIAFNAQISELEKELSQLNEDKSSLETDLQNSSEEAGSLVSSYEEMMELASLYVQGNYLSAATALEQFTPNEAGGVSYQALYELMKADYEVNMVPRLYQQAVAARESQNDRDAAIAFCEKILEIDPTQDTALHYEAVCYQEKGDNAKASELYLNYMIAFPNGALLQDVRTQLYRIAPQVLVQFDMGALSDVNNQTQLTLPDNQAVSTDPVTSIDPIAPVNPEASNDSNTPADSEASNDPNTPVDSEIPTDPVVQSTP